MQRRLFTILLAALIAAGSLPLRVSASCTTTLIVQLLDVQAHGVGNAQITVQHASSAGTPLQATTDPQGMATFGCIDAGTVRILVSGAAPNGQRLVQTGDDRNGIRFQLSPGDNSLLLRIEPDGAVVPDPTEWAPIGGNAPVGDLNGLNGQHMGPAPAITRSNRPIPTLPTSADHIQPVSNAATSNVQPATGGPQATPWYAWAVLGGLIALGLAIAFATIRIRSVS